MSHLLRDPRSCPHRKSQTITDFDHGEHCDLVRQMVVGLRQDAAACAVSENVCRVCCEFPIPEAPRLNPVVASLVYTAAAPDCHDDMAIHQQVLRQQVREFSRQRLGQVDNVLAGAPQADTHPRSQDQRRAGVPVAIGRILKRRCRPLRIGLAGWNSRFGLGHLNRDFAKQIKVASWLAPLANARGPVGDWNQCELAPANLSKDLLRRWVKTTDVVVFAESPPFANLIQVARECRVPIVCIPTWEWIRPGSPWMTDVDLMLCPTQHTFQLLSEWKKRFGFRWELEFVQWPIDVRRFQFRHRTVCRRFVFVGGSGGYRARYRQGNSEGTKIVRRKGLEVIMEAARQLTDSQFLVFTSESVHEPPTNVQVRGLTEHNDQLYSEGDVCVQPSLWEGIGLPLLECQAAGMPLITTDAAPMNEYQPLATIPIREGFVGTLAQDMQIPVPVIKPEDLCRVLTSVEGLPIGDASYRARRYVQQEHSWSKARPQIRAAIGRLVRSRV